MDVSGSMGCPITNNILLAKEAGKAWVLGLPDNRPWECAITAFNDRNYLIKDFTNNRTDLLDAIEKLTPNGGTNYDAAFIEQSAGVIRIAETGKYKRVLVFLSDGMPNFEPQTARIINEAQQAGIIVYAVTLRMPCPQCLKDISTQTGGQWFENVTTVEEARAIYLRILQLAQNSGKPCEIEWKSDYSCNISRNVELQYLSLGLNTTITYDAPGSIISTIKVWPNSIYFGEVVPPQMRDATITIQAVNRDVTISGIVTNNARFTIIDYGGSPPPFTLGKNKTRDITIRYTAPDSGFVSTWLEIISDACYSEKIYLTAGFKGKIANNSLRLVHPNGGEEFIVGIDTVFIWEGVLPTDTVKLEYSTDGGASWNLITDKATGLKYIWKGVPNTPSKRCLGRVTYGFTTNSYTNIYLLKRSTQDLTVEYFRNFLREYNFPFFEITASDAAKIDFSNSVIIAGFESEPTEYKTVASKILGAVQNGGMMIVESFGKYLLQYAGLGTAVSSGWGPAVLDKYAYVTNITNHPIFSGVPTWDPPTQPDKSGQYIWYLTQARGTPSVDFRFSSNVQIDSLWFWNLFITYGWNGQATNSSYCQKWGGCRRDRSVFKLYLQLIHYGSGLIFTSQWFPNNNNLHYGPITKLWHKNFITMSKMWKKTISDVSDSLWSIVRPELVATDVNFGDVCVGSYKDTVLLSYLKNTGTFPFVIDSINISGKDAQDFYLVSEFSPPSFSLGPNESRILEIGFKPSAPGLRTADLNIYSGINKFTQKLFGIGADKSIEVITKRINFGDVKVKKLKDTTITVVIENRSTKTINVIETNVIGIGAEYFSILSGGGSFSLAPGEKREITVRFSPKELNRVQAFIEFVTNDDCQNSIVELFGKGIPFPASILSTINKSGNLICETFANDTIQISNTGGEDLVIRTINITGANSTEFEINETLPITIPPDSTRAIVVTFRPKTVGDKTAEIVIESNADPDSVMTLQLSGRKEQVSISATSNIDLGTLCPNESKDFEITISNEGTIRTRVECHPGNDIGITDTIININTGASKQIQCRFTGISQEGNFTRTIRIIDTCGVETNVNVTGKVEMPRVQANDVIISTVLGSREQGKLIVTNVSGREITITEIRGLQQPFAIVGNPFPLVIKPNESSEITIEYTPTDSAKVNQQVELIGEPCGFVHEVSVTGSSFYATAQLKTIEVSGYAGDEIEVPIILNEAENLTKASVSTIDVELRFNPTLLAPKGYAVEKIDEKTAKIKIENLPANAQKGDVLGRIKCIVGLGNAEACELQLSNAKANGGPADISLVNGKFTLLGICNEGGKRLINPSKVTQLLKIAPNPSDGNVKIELNLVEDGTTILRIYNWQGVAIEERRYTEASKVEITLNTENYATGLYLVELQTPTIVKRELLIIRR